MSYRHLTNPVPEGYYELELGTETQIGDLELHRQGYWFQPKVPCIVCANRWARKQTNTMKLEITKEKVLEAASKCSTADATLRVLFPEAFKKDYPLQVGDVYKCPRNNIYPFVLVQVQYNADAWVLLGMGLAPNSNQFHQKISTKEECRAYLEKQGMEYSHNINYDIYKLHTKGAKVIV